MYRLEIAEEFRPLTVQGIDPAANAVLAACARIGQSSTVSFETGDIYNVEARGESLAIVRGVLHHLDRPQDAIARLARQFTSVIALEPNGYNSGLKVIENVSSYHRQHDEKSYWPPVLNHWFERADFSVVVQKFFCLVPSSCPTAVAKILRSIEPVVESMSFVQHIACGTNLVLYRLCNDSPSHSSKCPLWIANRGDD